MKCLDDKAQGPVGPVGSFANTVFPLVRARMMKHDQGDSHSRFASE